MIGYRIFRPETGGNQYIFAGTTAADVAEAIQMEIESHEGLSLDECDKIVVEACSITQEEIDSMPEFEGW